MSMDEAKRLIEEVGPRIRESYGWDYYRGWCAGIRAAVNKNG